MALNLTVGAPGFEAPPTAPQLPVTTAPAQSLHMLLDSQRSNQIREALKITGGNKLAAAKRLGIARSSLYKYLRRT